MNKSQFLQLVIGTIETSFETECMRQGVINRVVRDDLSVLPDRESLIRAIVFGVSTRFSDQYEADLESLIHGDIAIVKTFDIKRISRRIMKSRVAQQYLINQRLKQFGMITHFTTKTGSNQLIIKGATTDFVYASQHRSTAVLKLLRSQWPHLLGIEGRCTGTWFEYTNPENFFREDYGNRYKAFIDACAALNVSPESIDTSRLHPLPELTKRIFALMGGSILNAKS